MTLIKLEFRRKLREEGGNLPADIRDAALFRTTLDAATDEQEREIVERLIDDQAERIAEKTGSLERGQVFATRALGKGTLRDAWEAWMQTCDLTPGTQAKYRRALEDLLSHLGESDTIPAAITQERALAYVTWLNTGPLDPATKQGRVIALSAFWRDYLQPHNLVPHGSNPWRGHKFTGAKQKARTQKDERPYTDEELLRVFDGPERGKNTAYTKRTMLELYALGLYTGARLDEICSRKVGDLEPIRGGYLMHIREAKTPAGVRSLPILHPIPVAVIKRRIGKRDKDKDAFLFAEFIPGGPDNKRSWQIQKALGHYRKDVGLPKGVVFHSTRGNFGTVLEERGIDLRWTWRYVGHTARDLLTKGYSRADTLREVAKAIRYPVKLENAFRSALGIN